MSKAWKAGSTRHYRKMRAYVLERDNHRCQVRLDGCTTIATQAHHTGAREVTGDDPAHMVAACAYCNLKVGDPRTHDPAPTPRTRW